MCVCRHVHTCVCVYTCVCMCIHTHAGLVIGELGAPNAELKDADVVMCIKPHSKLSSPSLVSSRPQRLLKVTLVAGGKNHLIFSMVMVGSCPPISSCSRPISPLGTVLQS